jgi:hypothetical protein
LLFIWKAQKARSANSALTNAIARSTSDIFGTKALPRLEAAAAVRRIA